MCSETIKKHLNKTMLLFTCSEIQNSCCSVNKIDSLIWLWKQNSSKKNITFLSRWFHNEFKQNECTYMHTELSSHEVCMCIILNVHLILNEKTKTINLHITTINDGKKLFVSNTYHFNPYRELIIRIRYHFTFVSTYKASIRNLI